MSTYHRAEMPSGPTSHRVHERVEVLDVLRGFALFGILLVNFPGGIADSTLPIDKYIGKALSLFVSNSFYSIFAILFGVGIAIQRIRLNGYGLEFLVRRLSVLMLIGSVHAVLVWPGDILVDYAYFGAMLLVLVRFVRLQVLLLITVLLFTYPIVSVRVSGSVPEWLRPDAGWSQQVALMHGSVVDAATARQEVPDAKRRTFSSDIKRRWRNHQHEVIEFLRPSHIFYRNILPLMLFGYVVGSMGWYARLYDLKFALLLAAGGLVAAGSSLLYLHYGEIPEFRWLTVMLLDYAVTLFYVGAVSSCMLIPGWVRNSVTRLGPVGRVALSNYLLQSIVMTWLFLPYGVGQQRLSSTGFLMFHVAFFSLVQVPISRVLLQNYHTGPAEWLWRTVATGRRQPFRHSWPASYLKSSTRSAGPFLG